MDFDKHKADLVAFYVRMASSGPAWKRYAWDRVNELKAQQPRWFGDMPDLLTAAMKEAIDERKPEA